MMRRWHDAMMDWTIRLVACRNRVGRLLGPVAILLLLTTLDLFARAGGGGQYTGGGRGGGGSGGDGDGLMVIVYLLIRLCVHHPIIGIPLVMIIVVVSVVGAVTSKRGAEGYHKGSTIRRGRQMQEKGSRIRAINEIQQRDPGFTEEVLMQRVEMAFLKLQAAWCAHELAQVRPFISDGIYERFSLQFQEQKELGVLDHMEEVHVDSAQIVQIESDELFDTVTVRIQASAIDYRVDAESGKFLSGSKSPESFVEYWSFLRRPGAQTRTGSGLIEGNCPNCGDSLKLNEAAQCRSCQALIKSGEYDWVLAEITQACEWQVKPAVVIPGAAEMQAADPGFSVQHLEDRASVMYWRMIASLRMGKIAPVRKMATEPFCKGLSKDMMPDADGNRIFPSDCAVGAVETIGIVVGETLDRALVHIRWSGTFSARSRDGKVTQASGSQVATDVMVLVRDHGATGEVGAALSSAHCPGCGAPAGEGLTDACEYCGVVLNDGSNDWVLDRVAPSRSPEIIALIEQLPRPDIQEKAAGDVLPALGELAGGGAAPAGGIQLTAWIVKVMLADLVIDEKERAMLDSWAAARHIPPEKIDQLIHSVQSGQLEAPMPASADEARLWLREMTIMALADGFVVSEEKQMLMQVGKMLNFTAYDVNQLIRRTKTELYQQTKAQMREWR